MKGTLRESEPCDVEKGHDSIDRQPTSTTGISAIQLLHQYKDWRTLDWNHHQAESSLESFSLYGRLAPGDFLLLRLRE